jgi:hypothetical protein
MPKGIFEMNTIDHEKVCFDYEKYALLLCKAKPRRLQAQQSAYTWSPLLLHE